VLLVEPTAVSPKSNSYFLITAELNHLKIDVLMIRKGDSKIKLTQILGKELMGMGCQQ